MNRAIIILGLALMGCSQGWTHMTRKEVIAAAKECTDAGMKYRLLTNISEETYQVECRP